jgi:predicted transcriptional regulator
VCRFDRIIDRRAPCSKRIQEQPPVVTLADIANILENNDIQRVPVIEDGRLAGIVSRSDVLRGLASAKTAGYQSATDSDRGIQQAIVKLIKENTSVSLRAASIIVDDGMVSLWGTVESEEECAAIRAAAETLVGVGKVYDNLNIRADAL